MVEEGEDHILEATYQGDLKAKIRKMIPGAIVLKNDPNDIQGIPDLEVHYKNQYAMLEVKVSETASHRPNQDYYIEMYQGWGVFAEFIYPENEEEVLNALQRQLLG